MKSLRFLLLAGVLGATAHAQSLLLSDFSSFTPGYYSQAFDGAWSEATALSGPTSFTIADFGNGTPSDSAGNAFIQWLGDTPQDWSQYASIELTGAALAGNSATTLNFYLEDAFGHSSLTAFSLGDFSLGLTTVTAALDVTGLDLAHIAFWGFQVNGFDSPAAAIAFEFDNAALVGSAIPEPSTVALLLGGAGLAVALVRRRKLARA